MSHPPHIRILKKTGEHQFDAVVSNDVVSILPLLDSITRLAAKETKGQGASNVNPSRERRNQRGAKGYADQETRELEFADTEALAAEATATFDAKEPGRVWTSKEANEELFDTSPRLMGNRMREGHKLTAEDIHIGIENELLYDEEGEFRKSLEELGGLGYLDTHRDNMQQIMDGILKYPVETPDLGLSDEEMRMLSRIARTSHECSSPSAKAKARVVEEIARVLKDDQTFKAYAQEQMGSLDARCVIWQVNQLIGQWAETSGDHNGFAIASQLAIQEEFGLTDAATNHYDALNLKRANRILEKDGAGLRRFYRTMYDNTQRHLQMSGFSGDDEVVMFRGAALSEDDVSIGEGEFGRTTLRMAPMSSYSLSLDTAITFASGQYSKIEEDIEEDDDDEHMVSGMKATVVAAKIRARDILGFPETGLGCLGESEFVVLGGKLDVEMSVIKPDGNVNDDMEQFGEHSGLFSM